MQIEPLGLGDACLIRGVRHGDHRGWFEEAWSESKLASTGFDARFVQDNLAFSAEAGTLRGLHCQVPPAPQGKLVRVITGAILDVIVDVRAGSSTYGQHVKVELRGDEPVAIWAPEGFLHGLLTLKPNTRVLYKVSGAYSAEHDRAIAWNDPDLAIDWGISDPILSAKDKAAPRLSEAPVLFPEGSLP